VPLWALKPLDPDDSDWQASSYQGLVIARAPDEQAARDVAERAFGVKTRFPPGAGVKAPPWKRPNLVTAEIVEDPRFEETGPTEVLFPAV